MKRNSSKNLIWKSFETFVTQPIGFLCNKIIRIVNIKTDLFGETGINAEILNNSIQVNVINSDGAYNLLSAVAYKKRLQALRRDSLGSTPPQTLKIGVQTSPFGEADFARKAILENKKRSIFN